jgi:hypothetical protein
MSRHQVNERKHDDEKQKRMHNESEHNRKRRYD